MPDKTPDPQTLSPRRLEGESASEVTCISCGTIRLAHKSLDRGCTCGVGRGRVGDEEFTKKVVSDNDLFKG